MRYGMLFFMTMLLLLSREPAAAEPNSDLVAMLNRIRALAVTASIQCEYHDEQFEGVMPYHRILLEKSEAIEQLEQVILDIGGKIGNVVLPTKAYPSFLQAVNADAAFEIEIIRSCDELLAKYGHPQVRKVVQAARNRAFHHYLMLSNAAQKSLIDAGISEDIQK